MKSIHIANNSTLLKFEQVAEAIKLEIEKGNLKRNDQLPSITAFSKAHAISRDTVEKAFKKLIREGYVKAFRGKGNFVAGTQDTRLKVLLIFNKLSSYKKIVYDAIISELGSKAKVDLQIHYYNPQLLADIVDESLGHYHYYVIMPHFVHGTEEATYLKTFQKIPSDQLVLLDKDLPQLSHSGIAVYQDFKKDIYHAFVAANDLMEKYEKIVVVFPRYSNHPVELNEGVLQFCTQTGKEFSVIADADKEDLERGTLYIVLIEDDLAILIKKTRTQKFTPGREIGILSFNETVLKELLNVTVITTDFEKMGRTVAQLIREGKSEHINNPFFIIRRDSV
ncbi:GntR family transcriptional regulator [Sphingobacterium pedocola]|uniref:GntR family transcriptional regulator n=1 Tax=Sphingobacterium pedocola TaxID=2082722 RepID=A0ABR9T9F4_9SPHI|nr:winged helix-turn-helix domain-containing protein [Sphingobacterium pedocola]MBE8721980.1 GntR family transcriptional regulator [Sphingobacterium pedocola]